MDDFDARADRAQRAARDGGAVARRAFRTGIDVEKKGGKTDVVTQADRDAQKRVVERIRGAYPDDAIVGEEEDELKEVPDSGASWIVDPIDGTNNFVRNVPVWATSVAAVLDGEPVAAANSLPAMEDLYAADSERAYRNGQQISVSQRNDPETCTVCPTFWWDFDARDEYAAATEALVTRFGDIRRYGSMQVVLSFLADGALDGVVTNKQANPWDSVAGVHLVRMAGGTVTDLEGNEWRHDSQGLVASNGHIHDTLLDAAREIES
ncbi:putative inositol-1(or 4)-monophosphatase / fructose-1,6-bisphosphatase [Haloferax elongans ATCC BAA-1513]|uniref:fructose-bisphosphatase n=1 Tax=Haloferax elongans ATCC BAA-1513 TaxID=1230453 RepID=M0HES5_HALEO|nr:inositol monophosphatase [Haloferax elongans]ELZ83016.1 putative inositol-1(or 4)-monophosphatase / fructose-1,6-bisphosphatase [Haloferax elongans ATCC BAA-1513]